MERATHSGRPDIQRILLRDMRECSERLGKLIERRKRLNTLKGDRHMVESVSINLEHEAVTETADVIAILHARLSVTT